MSKIKTKAEKDREILIELSLPELDSEEVWDLTWQDDTWQIAPIVEKIRKHLKDNP